MATKKNELRNYIIDMSKYALLKMESDIPGGITISFGDELRDMFFILLQIGSGEELIGGESLNDSYMSPNEELIFSTLLELEILKIKK